MIKVLIDESKLNTVWRRGKAKQIEHEFQLIVNSELFKEKVLGIKYKHGELSHWGKASNEEFYNYFMSGSSVLQPEADKIINIELDDYYTWRGVIGYTYPNINTIYVNTKFYDNNDLRIQSHHRKLTGSNFIHEASHKMGCDHDFNRTARRAYSLSYLLNEIYEECWDRIVLPTLEKRITTVTYRRWFRTYTEERIEAI
jgi:hypothetical protein